MRGMHAVDIPFNHLWLEEEKRFRIWDDRQSFQDTLLGPIRVKKRVSGLLENWFNQLGLF